MLKKISNSPYAIWVLLALPWVVMNWQYLSGGIYYGEFIHVTGEFSARLLILTLAVTPLRLAWPGKSWTAWLIQRRRYFGVASFAYALPHLVAYIAKIGTISGLLEEAAEPGLWTGWIALFLFLPLAITSNNASVRKLGNRWRTLHKLAYFVALFSFLHWVLVAFNPAPGFAHAGLLVFLECYRLWKSNKAGRSVAKA